jgi:large subunit ribosomal protein L4
MAATVQVRNATGDVVGERELPGGLFDAPINVAVMHQVVTAGLAARRSGTHSTKTRGDVSGGGKKPWRQKGTGRARQGSTRAPHWTGGGVVFGPRPRDHSVRVNRKMRQAAFRSALSDAARSGKVAVVEGLTFEEPSTRDAVGVLEALELGGRLLVVIAQPDAAVEKSFRNLAHVRIRYPTNVSTYELLYADAVLFTADALDRLADQRGSGPAAETPGEPDTAAPSDAPEGPDQGEADADAGDDAGEPLGGPDDDEDPGLVDEPAEGDTGDGDTGETEDVPGDEVEP